ncbi:hypothetical protein QE380_001477 [Acinetobacter baylyi]|uniref:Uncharacterized protein n=1 Tax=Acinetobacter baylyi TaxID=202950 RepID=A0ABU0UVG5_ACIBI|nr:hypothetical protein [Acinetobacter baylyi]MDR6107856.1 hypothetical protein [Acinetobacter baylyi]MDR6185428.1 hypothetical protein [Acinetobacter baylyi]
MKILAQKKAAPKSCFFLSDQTQIIEQQELVDQVELLLYGYQ